MKEYNRAKKWVKMLKEWDTYYLNKYTKVKGSFTIVLLSKVPRIPKKETNKRKQIIENEENRL
jgi:hypothetical protein